VRRTLDAPGTRVLTLPDSGLQPDSETVELVTTDPRTGEQ